MTIFNQAEGDEIFDLLVSTYDSMSAEEAKAFLARLCLLFIHKIGDAAAIREVIKKEAL